MKKSTLFLGLLGLMCAANAATVDDLVPLKHSYVLACDELGSRPGKGVLFGNDHFLDVTGGSTATNKGSVDLSQPGATTYTYKDKDNNEVVEDIPQYITDDVIAKYGSDYSGSHYNWLRLKNTQDVIAMKLTAGSKVIMYLQGNNKIGTEARYPRISTKADLSDALNAAPDANSPRTVSGFRWEYTVNDDDLYYIGSYNGDMFVSYIIIEANEAAGTPRVKVGAQTYDATAGLWYREVTCTPVAVEGSPTVCTYTTDGTAANENSTVYTEPIKCYQDMTVKFQAYLEAVDKDLAMANADNEAAVSFSFDAPTLSVDGATFAIVNNTEGAKNYYSYGDGAEQQGDGATLTESATVTAYSKIVNGEYTTFTTKSVSADVLVLNPIKADKKISVTGTAVVDQEATNAATDGSTVYTTTDAALAGADKMDFFVKNLEFGVLANLDAAKSVYQVPANQEAYIKMNSTNITFVVADGDSVDVIVTCTKNSCKDITKEQAKGVLSGQDTITVEHQCFVNLSGTNYGGEDLVLNPEGNVIKFGLQGGTYTFQKYSGTGNILISSIEIKYAGTAAIETVAADDKNAAAKVVFQNGKFFISTAKGKVDLVGVQVK